ncbi:hypothetical protein N7G274_002230 [Stereocaulon virgatum]|uniref:Uncharacterized protein n=1 Tax=Stereocaulon virgatum TaxID=373712 RepID=A0ABR4AHA6_9LECA
MRILNAPYLIIAIALQLCGILAASVPALAASKSLIHNSIDKNLTLPLNLIHGTSWTTVPSDPWNMAVPGSIPDQTLRFSHYGASIEQYATIRTLLEATNDVISHQRRPGGTGTRMGTRDIQYSVGGNVILIVWPGSQMTWTMWGDTVRGVTGFLMRWSFVEVKFKIFVSGYGEAVGEGRLLIA